MLELKVPPAVIVLITAALMRLISVVLPEFTFIFPGRPFVAGFLVFGGITVTILGVFSFHQAKTTLNPMIPDSASALVVEGIYKVTRNPMYLGFLLMLIGWAVFLSNLLSYSVIPAFVIYMNRFQITPEEKALEALFQDRFRAYKAKVRRWL
ncbi:Protein-S-isoprenylcysteine methyltransferase [Candidatus Methylobacter favarea]|uniref:Protein-S-isoprenylcysteine methyltransferase n=1 Tax=Candidatus Methylobacter favarea TaxID=2707345 RepID=A0A8S0W985_9GAMM|nr:isoprenylcysteine carboxylmethyltransferase family protein [Candidatus Methylobacter favarea]CAA9889794.1 Protein-S-isoprenylcysteine methyltransferase [Candidatus Methylobacter favarea]